MRERIPTAPNQIGALRIGGNGRAGARLQHWLGT
jgi:hypothetical protein